jgi:hypothetical protein
MDRGKITRNRQAWIRLRRCILEMLFAHFMEYPYAPLEMEAIAEHCAAEAKLMNWNIVYLEKCGFVELGTSIEAPPFAACSASITASGVDLVEDDEQFNNRFPMGG